MLSSSHRKQIPRLTLLASWYFSVSMAASLPMTEPNTLVAAFAITSAVWTRRGRALALSEMLATLCGVMWW